METVEWKDPETGRLYEALRDGDSQIVVGPPEGLMEALRLPEPFATTLHNVLYRRRLFTYRDVTRNRNALAGALQEALNLDIQLLTEAFLNSEKEEILP